jgi:cell division protein FtsZ
MGGYDLGMLEVNEAADQIEKAADKDAIVIFGASVREELQDEIVITVIATGFEERNGDKLSSINRDIIRPGRMQDETMVAEAPDLEESSDQKADLPQEDEFEKRYNTDFAIPSFLNKGKNGNF